MRYEGERGSTLLDVIVGSALMLVVFVGISAAFKLAVEAVGNNKSRAGAIALATERIEFVRSLSYGAIGTVGGIPSGSIEQIEEVFINAIPYTRRTLILYGDDPGDGLGLADENGITADYKVVKVSVSWDSRQATRTVEMITRVSPVLVETAVPGGTLALRVVDSLGQVVPGAQIHVLNTTVSPSVDMVLFSDIDGAAQVIGAPAGSGYQIVVTKDAFSSARTYDVTPGNTNPIPGHVAVADSQTTSATFAIDVLSSLTIETYEPPQTIVWDDDFSTSNQIDLSSSVAIAGGVLRLPGNVGEYASQAIVYSVPIGNASIDTWGEFSWNDTVPLGSSVVYRLYDENLARLPNAALPGNANGFTSGPIDLSGVSTSTYSTLVLGAELATANSNVTPEITSWEVSYTTRPIPYPNVALFVEGAKIIGGDSGGALIHKYGSSHSSGASGRVHIDNLEYDNYVVTIDASENLDISSSCLPQPTEVPAGSSVSSQIYVVPRTANSLLIDVRASNGDPLPEAQVRLYRTGYNQTFETDYCGNVHVPSLSPGTVGAGNPYSVEVVSSGYGAYTSSEVSVSGTTRFSVILSESI